MANPPAKDITQIQMAINAAKHPLSCSIWKTSICSCEAQARAVLSQREKDN